MKYFPDISVHKALMEFIAKSEGRRKKIYANTVRL